MTKLDRLSANASYNPEGKEAFRKEAMRLLRAFAKKGLGLDTNARDLRFNEGGIAVSGEATLHTEFVYIQISGPLYTGRGACILVRACKDRNDYSGMQNNYVTADVLYDVARMKSEVIRICQQAGRLPRTDGTVPNFDALAYA